MLIEFHLCYCQSQFSKVITRWIIIYSIVILMVIIGYECKCIQGTTRFIQNEFIKVMVNSIMSSIHFPSNNSIYWRNIDSIPGTSHTTCSVNCILVPTCSPYTEYQSGMNSEQKLIPCTKSYIINNFVKEYFCVKLASIAIYSWWISP